MWTEIVISLVIILLFWFITRKRNEKVSLNITGKHVLITGCDSGLGRATAMQLDKMGARVLATCLTKEGEQRLKSAASDKLKTFQMDVTNSHQILDVFRQVSEVLAEKGLWGLVNNAGILVIGPIEWVPLADFKRNADVNLWGLIDVTKTFLSLVKKAKGRVVLVGSVAGVVSPQTFSPYTITKHGVEAFADSLRREMRAFDVQVSVIEPGATRTPVLNEELLTDRLNDLWDKLPPERQLEYGEDYLKASTKGFQDWCKSGSPHVTKVVDSIVSPLMSQFPRPRYVIGSDAWLLKLTSYFPEVLQDIILRDFPFKVPTASDDRANSVFPQMNGSVS